MDLFSFSLFLLSFFARLCFYSTEAGPVAAFGTLASEDSKQMKSVFPDQVFPTANDSVKSKKGSNPVKKENLKTTVTTTTTTQSVDAKNVDYDYYYEYQGDQGPDIMSKMVSTVGAVKEPTKSPQSLGCPKTHAVCQHYCENKRYYSGYCEGESCRCYGKLAS